MLSCYYFFIAAYNKSQGHGSRRKPTNRANTRRISTSATPAPTTLVIPQLDAIQRSQKLLDVRLQHLQASSKENQKLFDDVEFLRRVMTENQKALFNIIQALSNMQGEIVNLVKCLAPPPLSTQTNTHIQSNAHPQQNSVTKSGKKRPSHPDNNPDDESEV